MQKSIASILCVLSFVAFAAPTVSYQTATNIAKKVIDQKVTKQFVENLGIEEEIVQATNRLSQTLTDAIDAHVADTNNPHAVTAAQVGALPLIEDSNGQKTAVTIGNRRSGESVGPFSIANGNDVTASEYYSHAEGSDTVAAGATSHAEGLLTIANGQSSHAEGRNTAAYGSYSHTEGCYSKTRTDDDYAFAWNGDDTKTVESPYTSHGEGTFNINPYGGLGGFFIGDRSLSDIFDGRYLRSDSQGGPPGYVYIDTNVYFSTARTGNLFVDSFDDIRMYDEHGEPLEDWVKYIVRTLFDANDSDFSNAVLAVGLNIDTNSVAVLNDIAATFGGFPITGTATTVGGLLAALAAAIAWLKRNKVQTLKLEDNSVETSADGGVAKLDDFFTGSNSLLNGCLAYSRNATGLKDRAFNALTFDGTEYNLSTALAAVTPTASGQPRDLLIVATATAATTISFTAGTIKGDKPTIDGSGTWLITLTEYASGVWYCRQIKMEDAA